MSTVAQWNDLFCLRQPIFTYYTVIDLENSNYLAVNQLNEPSIVFIYIFERFAGVYTYRDIEWILAPACGINDDYRKFGDAEPVTLKSIA